MCVGAGAGRGGKGLAPPGGGGAARGWLHLVGSGKVSLTLPAAAPPQIEARTGAPLWQSFDLVCGTSTGGLLAVAIGVLRLSLADCDDIYTKLSAKASATAATAVPVAVAVAAPITCRGSACWPGLERQVHPTLFLPTFPMSGGRRGCAAGVQPVRDAHASGGGGGGGGRLAGGNLSGHQPSVRHQQPEHAHCGACARGERRRMDGGRGGGRGACLYAVRRQSPGLHGSGGVRRVVGRRRLPWPHMLLRMACRLCGCRCTATSMMRRPTSNCCATSAPSLSG